MKRLICIVSLFLIFNSCQRKETAAISKLSSCDSIKLWVRVTTSDTLRLLSCFTITGCDSARLGLLKRTQDTIRLLSCTKISAEDSMRFGLINIGQKYQGGIIAYFLVSGDRGFDANKKHGIISATSNQIFEISWNNGSNTTTGATQTAIGTGLSNTNAIITSQGGTSTSYAAGIARAYNGGGYTDWYLPSKDELNILYLNKDKIGPFSSSHHWSSSEFNNSNALYQIFTNDGKSDNGYQGNTNKGKKYTVRAIRAF